MCPGSVPESCAQMCPTTSRLVRADSSEIMLHNASLVAGQRVFVPDPVKRRQSSAPEIEREASFSFTADTDCLVSIHVGTTSRSPSGRFIAKAATRRFRCSHHTLKLLVERSPR